MRAVETFQEVYAAARDMANNTDITDISGPMDPIIRREAGEWRLDSRLIPAPDADLEVTLEDFDAWFYEAYKYDDYTPSESDMEAFVAEVLLYQDNE